MASKNKATPEDFPSIIYVTVEKNGEGEDPILLANDGINGVDDAEFVGVYQFVKIGIKRATHSLVDISAGSSHGPRPANLPIFAVDPAPHRRNRGQ